MKLIELCCKNCGASLQPENLSMQLLIARCPHCDAVFAIADASRTASAAGARARERVAMPRQIQVLDQGDCLGAEGVGSRFRVSRFPCGRSLTENNSRPRCFPMQGYLQ